MVSVVEVAAMGRLTKGKDRGENWGPCPICDAGQTSRKDKRPPLRLKKQTNEWVCVAGADGTQHGGGPVMLARALHARGDLTDEQLQRVRADADQAILPAEALAQATPGDLDVAGGWRALLSHHGLWRERVRRWCLDRGLGDEIGRLAIEGGGVAAVPQGRRPNGLGDWLRAVSWRPLDLLIAVRDVAGDVVDIERRYIRGQGKPERAPKTARLNGDATGGLIGPLMFGSLPRAVTAAQHGEPIVLVEGSADWIAANGACRARKRGEVLGAPGARALIDIAKALREALEAAHVVPGSVTVHIVPDVGDLRGKPSHRDFRIGEISGWNAAIELLEVARVLWCLPHPNQGDLGDALAGTLDPVAAFWALIENGLTVLDSGQKIIGERGRFRLWADRKVFERWHRAKDWELGQAAYRLPLHELIHYHHYAETEDKDGQPTIEFRRTMRPLPNMSGDLRTTRALTRWLRAHRIEFTKDAGGQWIYDPLERARPPLVAEEPPRQLPRLLKVGSDEHWDGWLQELGYVNPAATGGRLIERALRQLAQRSATSTLRSWLTADPGPIGETAIRLHLHTRMEQVLVLDDRGLGTVPNGTDRQVLQSVPRVPRIDFVGGMEAGQAAWLFWQLIGSSLTVEQPLRSMMVAHPLMAPVREQLAVRPILYSTGRAGSGKSQLTKFLASWFYGRPDPEEATSAAAWEVSQYTPVQLLDNLEARFIESKMEKFLLNAATRALRQKRSTGSDRGVIEQQVGSLIVLNAINLPQKPEMLRRCLLVEHDRRWGRDGYAEGEAMEAVAAHRSALWTALMRLYQDRVRGALAEGRHREWAGRVPDDHPVESMREGLGVMAVIAGALSELCPMWGPIERVWPDWLARTGGKVDEARRNTDPLQLALDELLLQWNRTVDAYDGRRRPAIGDELFACRPLFLRSDGATMTPELRSGLENASGVAQVVAFEGTYPMLYRDLCEASRDARRFREALGSPKDVGHNIGYAEGWRSEQVSRKGRSGLRVYRWTNLPAVEDLRAQHGLTTDVGEGQAGAASEARGTWK